MAGTYILILVVNIFLLFCAVFFLCSLIRYHLCNRHTDEVYKKIVLLAQTGENILVFEPENPLWRGQAEYIKKRLEKLVEISREFGLFKENIVPIRIGAARLFDGLAVTVYAVTIYDEPPRYRNVIIFSQYLLKRKYNYIDDIAAHEFAHVLTKDEKLPHGPQWAKTYNFLLGKL